MIDAVLPQCGAGSPGSIEEDRRRAEVEDQRSERDDTEAEAQYEKRHTEVEEDARRVGAVGHDRRVQWHDR